jgi:hypothetical protein
MQDMDDGEEKEHAYCFLNSERACGADCMAYQTVAVDGVDYQTPDGRRKQWAACMLLIHSHKIAKHLTLLANIANTAEHRAAQTPPQPPYAAQVPK